MVFFSPVRGRWPKAGRGCKTNFKIPPLEKEGGGGDLVTLHFS